MTECPHLWYRKSPTCQSCTGYRCRATKPHKKLSDTTQCTQAYTECLTYQEHIGN